MSSPKPRRLREDRRGAVYVETLVAFLPVFMFFLATIQAADLSVAHLVVEHASSTAARAAVVVLPDDGIYYEDHDNAQLHQYTGLRRSDVELAADLVLDANPRLSRTAVELDKQTYAQRDDLTATVRASYRCLIPALCGGGLDLESQSKLVYQGAKFVYEPTSIGEVVTHRPHRRTPNQPGTPSDPNGDSPAPGDSPSPQNQGSQGGDPSSGDPHGGRPNDGRPSADTPTPDSPAHDTHPTPRPGEPNTPNTPNTPDTTSPPSTPNTRPGANTPNTPNTRPGANTPNTPSTSNTRPGANTPNAPNTQPGTSAPNTSTPSTPNTRPGADTPRNPNNTPGASTPNAPNAPNTPGTAPSTAPNRPNVPTTKPGVDPPSTPPGTTLPSGPQRPNTPPSTTPNTPNGPNSTGGTTTPGVSTTKPGTNPVNGPTVPATPPGTRPDLTKPTDPGTTPSTRPARPNAPSTTNHNPSSPGAVAANDGNDRVDNGVWTDEQGRRRLPVLNPQCFAAGTLIYTREGDRPIESLEVGDLIWSRDELTGELSLKPVTRLFVTEDMPVFAVLVQREESRESLTVTGGHPFWVESLGWVDSEKLEPGSRLWSPEGELLGEASTASKARTRVYNFEVQDFHSYFVGSLHAWVHNQSDCPPDDADGDNNGQDPDRGDAQGRTPPDHEIPSTSHWRYSNGKWQIVNHGPDQVHYDAENDVVRPGLRPSTRRTYGDSTRLRANIRRAQREQHPRWQFPPNVEANHNIPASVAGRNELTQRAQREGLWDIDDERNGSLLPTRDADVRQRGRSPVHRGVTTNDDGEVKDLWDHPQYNRNVEAQLLRLQDALVARYGSVDNIPKAELQRSLREFEKALKERVEARRDRADVKYLDQLDLSDLVSDKFLKNLGLSPPPG